MSRETGKGGVGAYLRERVEATGGLCEKLKFDHRRGPPDYLVTWPGGIMQLIETKWNEEAEVQAHQQRDHARRQKLGVGVFVLNTKEAVDRYVFVQAMLKNVKDCPTIPYIRRGGP